MAGTAPARRRTRLLGLPPPQGADEPTQAMPVPSNRPRRWPVPIEPTQVLRRPVSPATGRPDPGDPAPPAAESTYAGMTTKPQSRAAAGGGCAAPCSCCC